MVGTVIIQTGKFSVLVFSLAMVGTVIIQTSKFSVLKFCFRYGRNVRHNSVLC
jgi:hypothetical protein